jgi:opacity protein-like surface antigen
MNTSASGFAIDAGVQYRLNENVSLGAALMNIGTNMTYDGEDLVTTTEIPGSFIGTRGGTYKVLTESFQLPSYFQMSVAYQHSFNEQNNFVVATTYTANNAYEDVMNFGLEYGFMGTFFVRGGYNLAMQESENSIFGFTAGAGVDYRVSQDIGLVFDYAFRDVKEFPEPNHIMTVKLRFNN